MKSGYVAVMGRANAGKSTLVNVLVGEKVAIVSPKPQTTRDRIMGVLTTKDYQIVFVDTPGLYKADNLLNSFMQKTAEDTVLDVDAVLYVLDAHEGISEKEKELIEKFKNKGLPFILCISKIDITSEQVLISTLKSFDNVNFDIVPVSARKGKNVKELIKTVVNVLPTQDKIFEQDIISDRSERFMISEIVREKILLKCDKEIPHGVAIIVNKFEKFKDKKGYDISVDIICEKPNHKAIIIGKQGQKIKEISSFSRVEMEKFLGDKVFLTTYVKVKEDWRNSAFLMKEYGYSQDN